LLHVACFGSEFIRVGLTHAISYILRQYVYHSTRNTGTTPDTENDTVNDTENDTETSTAAIEFIAAMIGLGTAVVGIFSTVIGICVVCVKKKKKEEALTMQSCGV